MTEAIPAALLPAVPLQAPLPAPAQPTGRPGAGLPGEGLADVFAALLSASGKTPGIVPPQNGKATGTVLPESGKHPVAESVATDKPGATVDQPEATAPDGSALALMLAIGSVPTPPPTPVPVPVVPGSPPAPPTLVVPGGPTTSQVPLAGTVDSPPGPETHDLQLVRTAAATEAPAPHTRSNTLHDPPTTTRAEPPPSLAVDLQPLLSPRAPDALSRTAAALAPGAEPLAHDFGAIVDRLVAARQGSRAMIVAAAVTHADFGRVRLDFAQDADGLKVAVSCPDPGFALAAIEAAARTVQPPVQALAQASVPPLPNDPDTTLPRQADSPPDRTAADARPQDRAPDQGRERAQHDRGGPQGPATRRTRPDQPTTTVWPKRGIYA